jgi:hypothetical protein
MTKTKNKPESTSDEGVVMATKVAAAGKSKTFNQITIEIPGPVEPYEAQMNTDGMRPRRSPGDVGINPMYYSFATSRSLLHPLRDAPPEGRGVPVYPHKYPVTDEAEMSRNIKANARYFGADLVGIVELTPKKIQLGAYRKDQEAVAQFSHYIIVAKEMDALHFRSRLVHPNFPRPVRSPSASSDVHKSYSDVEKMCVHLADYIRGLGYNAESEGPSRRLLNGPFANWAGLGETGRNNVVITPEFGPRVRLGGVLTNLPMVEDEPVNLGIQKFCEVCKTCIRVCPSGALPKGPKEVVRGVLRWPLDRKRCSEIGWAFGGGVSYGCQQCLVVCPFNKPPGLMHDIVRWFIKNAPWMNRPILKGDDFFPSDYEQFMDYQAREEGTQATLGMWPELWHEQGWVDDYTPPPAPERRRGMGPGGSGEGQSQEKDTGGE